MSTPLRLTMTSGAPPAIAEKQGPLLADLFYDPRHGWWDEAIHVADSDDELLEYLRGRIRRFRLEMDGRLT